MKYMISMLLVAIFSCAATAQTPRLKADRVGQVFSPETRGDKEWSKLGNVSKTICLWQEKKSPVSHDVPIVCGKGDGECGVKDCKCTCHPKKDATCHSKKDAKKHDHKRGHSNDHKRGHHRGRTSSTKKTEARKGPGSHQPGPVRPSAISETLRQRLGEAVKDGRMSDTRRSREAIRKRIEEWRKAQDAKKDSATKRRTHRGS